ncbi:DUF6481 family protein [Lichenifustis flavocetrariae]|uniref:DUF6481 family protein n=1 Tax=Lichenifustis flavocetrariae TaxID=2949735 RepID=A0AA41Z0L3_9HYPH|nr:DUF6481 family protein [Lichenifustis flavocetrariae]MCW6508333.1 DUF6481 family protein [Lichenifustis flavocetrariae]
MSSFNHANFADRIKDAAKAKAAAVEKHKARPGADDPALIAKAAERRSLHEARVARAAEKDAIKQKRAADHAEVQRLRAEEELALALTREAELEAEEQAALALRRDRAKLALVNLADQKEVRDARYAARKARQKQAKRG